MRTIIPTSLLSLLILAGSSVHAQDAAAIQQKLVSEYALTQPTAANDDIVTAGAVLELKKVRIDMSPVSSTNLCQNVYKEGKMSQKGVCGGAVKASRWIKTIPGVGGSVPGGDPGTRTFVPGEKMWVTGIDVKPDGIYFSLFTDAISDVRYRTSVKFQFPKGFTLTADQVDKMVAEVFSVQPVDNSAESKQPAGPAESPQPASPASGAPPQRAPQQQTEAAPPPIAPPPPPTDTAPATIGIGSTPDQVIASLGQPRTIINKSATTQVYVYKDMKVTFVHGKVTDVQ